MLKQNCHADLKQISGTCYYNSVINGILLSNNILTISLNKLSEFNIIC
jgi:hypothetical protein